MNSHLRFAKYLAHSLDSQFKVGNLSFGLDPIIGLFPIVGDIVTTLVSLYIVWIGIEMKVPSDKIAQMVGNVVIDFLLDFIPLLGQVADFVWKANEMNLQIIEKYAPQIVDGKVYG
jgi:hypothetical protein